MTRLAYIEGCAWALTSQDGNLFGHVRQLSITLLRSPF